MNAICHMVWVYSSRNFKQKDLMYYCLPIIQNVQQKVVMLQGYETFLGVKKRISNKWKF